MLVRSGNRSTHLIVAVGLALVLALGLWLRWRFIQTIQLYPDEFVTLLAIRMIGEKGLPLMPSGLFYDHGLLFSYLGSVASFLGPSRLAVRYASLIFGGLSLVLIFLAGRRWFSPAVGLIATAGLVIAPTAIHWSGRARMYALLQMLVLVALWLAYEGITQNKAHLRWMALLTYLGATLTHFASITLAPPFILAGLGLWLPSWLERQAEKRRNKGLMESASPSLDPTVSPGWTGRWSVWIEPVALVGVLLIAFMVKRAGQPKGIEALDGRSGQIVAGVVEVFDIYSDFSFNLAAGWQAIAPFYLTLPALLFTPFAMVTSLVILRVMGTMLRSAVMNWRYAGNGRDEVRVLARRGQPSAAEALTVVRDDRSQDRNVTTDENAKPSLILHSPQSAALFLSIILVITTLEMILLVSPDRRDDKYQFMLLPVLLLLGARGITLVGNGLLTFSANSKLSLTNYRLPITNWSPLLVSFLILALTWPAARALLANTGDDYDSAFTYVQEHWQEGDTILTGTPSAAAFYLGRNDFYSVQRRGGYDYRLLQVDNQPVDRWLASPVIRTEVDLQQILAKDTVWLVLERWGLQREYYDLPFQQQLLAQTDYVTEAQGIFVLRSKPRARPIKPAPAQTVEVTFGNMVELTGYTIEPERVAPGQPLRLTLYWHTLAPMPDDYTVFVHLRHPDGSTLAQADHRPLGNLYPTTLWPRGEIIRETSELLLPAELAPGDYNLWAGLYLFETGQRLPIKDDLSGENAAKLGVLSVEK